MRASEPGSSRIDAFVLAAGASSRMGRPKALLGLGRQTYLEFLCGTLARVPLATVTVVLGGDRDVILARLPSTATALVNRQWRQGMLSSIRCAVAAARARAADAALMLLIDTPLVSATTVRALLAERQRSGAPIVLPTHEGRRGHPVVFGHEVWDALDRASPDVGARAVVADHAHDLSEVEVDDRWILRDADTPVQHRRMVRDARALGLLDGAGRAS